VLVNTRGLHTNRDWYGPSADRVTLERTSIHARVRGGQTAFAHRILVQPHLSLESHQMNGRTLPASGGGFSLPTGALPEASAQFQGLRGGLDVRYQSSPHTGRTASGVELQAGWERYATLTDDRLRFDRIDDHAQGTLALSGPHRLVAHVGLTTTRPRTSTSVPVFLLPVLDGPRVPGWNRGRFVDRDRLIGHLLYRFPLWSFGEVVALEGHAGAHLGGSYHDVGDQFSTDIRFEEPSPTADGRPLRPSASIGLRFDAPIRPGTTMDLALGLSPDGLSAVTFTVRRSLQALRPPHHVTGAP